MPNHTLATATRFGDLGLLLLRVVVGANMLLFHGWQKITAGPDRWVGLGGEMQHLGITFLPVFWGFMAAISESLGAVLLATGLLFRPAAALLAMTMLVAAMRHLNLPPDAAAAGWKGASHALELLAVFAALFLIGPGRYVLLPRGWRPRRRRAASERTRVASRG